ncbi:MAG: bifunctional methylenetetrahydrofolate dehydrogenase/methenyltetrahydrofolate cyclohydrolase FolD [Pseudomonadota bacterium]
MSAHLIDGKAVARAFRQQIAQRVAGLAALGKPPGLAVIIVGDDPASQVYVKNKVAACAEVGMHSVLERYPADLSETDLLAHIARLNHDERIHGILVQLPLPKHIHADKILAAISAHKDADGFHAESLGALIQDKPGFVPCTPLGCMHLLKHAGVDPKGKHAVVVGRSNIVGKPMAMLLVNASATVTVCHSQTQDLASITCQADILIAAVGKPHFITADMVKPGAVVIDVGINRGANGLVGDVDTEAVAQVASAITPVPGGVGPMTIAMLLGNTLQAYERSS